MGQIRANSAVRDSNTPAGSTRETGRAKYAARGMRVGRSRRCVLHYPLQCVRCAELARTRGGHGGGHGWRGGDLGAAYQKKIVLLL